MIEQPHNEPKPSIDDVYNFLRSDFWLWWKEHVMKPRLQNYINQLVDPLSPRDQDQYIKGMVVELNQVMSFPDQMLENLGIVANTEGDLLSEQQ